MKNKKFSIKVIERGRLTSKESNEIFGGGITCPNNGYSVTVCAKYTSCGGIALGDPDYRVTDSDGKTILSCGGLYHSKSDCPDFKI